MSLHCTCEVAFQVRTALQLYKAHHITRRRCNHDEGTRFAFITEVSMVLELFKPCSTVISPADVFDTRAS